MKICGIICEYNPFHNGHAYLLDEARKQSGCDAVVCVMSGDFTQRGEMAVLDKYTRAKHAVLAGADAVIELPVPFACAPASFLTARRYDQVKTDLAYSQTNVKLLGVSGGASYESLGQTHHSTNDIAAMRALPGMTVVIPADAASAAVLAEQALELYGPVYIRVGRAATANVYGEETLKTLTLGKASCLRQGEDGVILSCGVLGLNALRAAEELSKQGKELAVWDFHTVAPLDEQTIRALARRYGKLLTVEEHVRSSGFGSAVCVAASEMGVPVKVLAFPDENAPVGTADEIYADFGLDAASIAKEAAAWL